MDIQCSEIERFPAIHKGTLEAKWKRKMVEEVGIDEAELWRVALKNIYKLNEINSLTNTDTLKADQFTKLREKNSIETRI